HSRISSSSLSLPPMTTITTLEVRRKQEAVPPRWTISQIAELYELPFLDLLFRAQTVHREHHEPNTVQLSSLLSIKTGGCPEDCSYCPQSARYETEVEREKLMPLDEVLEAARQAKAG